MPNNRATEAADLRTTHENTAGYKAEPKNKAAPKNKNQPQANTTR